MGETYADDLAGEERSDALAASREYARAAAAIRAIPSGMLENAIADALENAGVAYPPLPKRDALAATRTIDRTIRYRLETLPSGDLPVVGLTPALSRDLAAHLACAIEEYGRDYGSKCRECGAKDARDTDSGGETYCTECGAEGEPNPEACPGCGCLPGDGLTDGCEDPTGCGYFRAFETPEPRVCPDCDGTNFDPEDGVCLDCLQGVLGGPVGPVSR
jgi:hypothetical protein